MTRDNAIQCALGYAWGREDASGTITAGDSNRTPSAEFADAFAQGWEDFNTQKRGDMIPVKDAYERWQASGGKSIFPPDNTTEAQRARHDAWRKEWKEHYGI